MMQGPPNLPLILQALKARAQGNPFPVPMGAGGSPDQGGMSAGPPDSGGGQSRQRALQHLKAMISEGDGYTSSEPDAEDRAVVAKCLAALHGVLAKDQKETDAATGVTPGAKVVRRASAGY